MQKLTTDTLKAHHQVQVTNEVRTTPKFNQLQRPKVSPATERQISYLRDLVARKAPGTSPEYVNEVIAGGFNRVSKALDRLVAMPDVKVAPKAAGPRTNTYAGKCEGCGIRVEPKTGILSKADDGKWEVSHKPGDCPSSDFPFPFGRYAVDTDDGHLAFYHLTHKGLFVQASDELHRIPGNAEKAIVDKIAADPKAASERYGKEIGACGRCGRTLTDAESRANGIGPVCAQKDWA